MSSSLFSSKPREMQYLQAPVSSFHKGASPPLSPRVRSRLYVDTASSQGGLSPTQQLLQRLSPQQQAAAAAVGLIQSTSSQAHAPPPPGVVYQQSPMAHHQAVRSSPVIHHQQQQRPSPIRAVQVQPPSMVMTGLQPHHVQSTSLPGPTSTPRDSPMFNHSASPQPTMGATVDLNNQSKSFRNLQINFSDGGKMEIPIRVDHHHQFGSPQQQGQHSPLLRRLMLERLSCTFTSRYKCQIARH